MNFTEAEIIFLDSEKQNGITSTMDSSAAYVRNLDRGIKEKYEAIYKRTINPKFVLCYWCGNEVFAMVRDVHKTYNMYKAHEAYKVQQAAVPEDEKIALASIGDIIAVQKRQRIDQNIEDLTWANPEPPTEFQGLLPKKATKKVK